MRTKLNQIWKFKMYEVHTEIPIKKINLLNERHIYYNILKMMSAVSYSKEWLYFRI